MKRKHSDNPSYVIDLRPENCKRSSIFSRQSKTKKLSLSFESQHFQAKKLNRQSKSVTSNSSLVKLSRTKGYRPSAVSGEQPAIVNQCPCPQFAFFSHCLKENDESQSGSGKYPENEISVELIPRENRKVSATSTQSPVKPNSERLSFLQHRQNKKIINIPLIKEKVQSNCEASRQIPSKKSYPLRSEESNIKTGQNVRNIIFNSISQTKVMKSFAAAPARHKIQEKPTVFPQIRKEIHLFEKLQNSSKTVTQKQPSPGKTDQTLAVSNVVPFNTDSKFLTFFGRVDLNSKKDLNEQESIGNEPFKIARSEVRLFTNFLPEQQENNDVKPSTPIASEIKEKDFNEGITNQTIHNVTTNHEQRSMKASEHSFEEFKRKKFKEMQENRLKNLNKPHQNVNPPRQLIDHLKQLDRVDLKLKQTESVNYTQVSPMTLQGSRNTRYSIAEKHYTNIYECIDKGEYVGVGRFSSVYVCTLKDVNFLFIMKEIFKFTLSMNKLQEQFMREIEIQGEICHPNVISLYYAYQDKDKYYIALEYGQTTLLKIIEEKHQIPEEDCIQYLKEIISGLQHLHEKGIIHRDIKPENMIIVNGVCKIADFGWSVKIDCLNNSVCGTPCYASPQILNCNQYSFKTDCWSLGILAYEIRYGKIPFNHKNELDLPVVQQTLARETKGQSSNYANFVTELIWQKQEQRMSIFQAKEHALLSR